MNICIDPLQHPLGCIKLFMAVFLGESELLAVFDDMVIASGRTL